jgi:hypothetical protein
MHPQAINKHLISAHAIVSCTMLVGGRLGHFWPLRRILAVSMAVARQVQALSFPRKIRKSGREVGLGWGCKVDGHMPWGALSGSRRVRGHKRVFGGCGVGFHAPVVQYLQYMQIQIIYLCIHALTH